jgi:hypothetical protein
MKRVLLPSLFAALLAGCTVGPVFSLKGDARRTCPQSDFLDYTGGLAFHVTQGNGNGTFDYDPPADHIARTNGFYRLKTGEFAYDVVYEDSWKATDEIRDGLGTLWRDGDHDLAWTLHSDWGDGAVRSYGIRSIRLGCEEDTRIEDLETNQVSYETRVYESDGFAIERQERYRGATVIAEGRGYEDGSAEVAVDYADGPFDLSYVETDDGHGHIRRAFDDVVGSDELQGFWETSAGGVTYDYTRNAPGQRIERWVFTLDGNGDGEGQVLFGAAEADSCGLFFEAGACTRQGCTNGANGACQPPVLASSLR